MSGTFISMFQNDTQRHMKVDDSTTLQAHHYCIEKLLQVKIQNPRNKLYMR